MYNVHVWLTRVQKKEMFSDITQHDFIFHNRQPSLEMHSVLYDQPVHAHYAFKPSLLFSQKRIYLYFFVNIFT